MKEIFESATNNDGRFAGVYEDDGETAYFYLYDLAGDGRILDHVLIHSGEGGPLESDVTIRWDNRGEKVALFIRGELWAWFDPVAREKQGGNYVAGSTPDFPRPASFSN